MKKTFSDFKLLIRMLARLRSLSWMMLLTIVFGVAGYLVAAGILVFAILGALSFVELTIFVSFKTSITIMIVLAISRGFLKYVEQLSGHYIAFHILANIRSQVFEKLKTLAPAKLDMKDQGDIITILTSDIESLEVFYAHTIAPIAIASITSLIFIAVQYWIHPYYALQSFLAYLLLGLILPLLFRNLSDFDMKTYRELFTQSNSYFLDALHGLNITIFFKNQTITTKNIDQRSAQLNQQIHKIKKIEALNFSLMDAIILLFIMSNLMIGIILYSTIQIDFSHIATSFIILSSSFGAVSAISALSTVFSGTIASARRLFDILDEQPFLHENQGSTETKTTEILFKDVNFSYPNRETKVIDNLNLIIDQNLITAIVGNSGIGKSTLLKLIMRYYDPTSGKVLLDNQDISKMPTQTLRNSQALIAQNSFLFNTSIEENIRMRDYQKTFSEVEKAAKKASIHEFITSLPDGYATKVGNLGERLSEGEKQRLTLARAFYKDSQIVLLDKPTSNLDVLNEAVILKSIKENSEKKQVILVSHRKSTTAIADEIITLER